jgi:predicted  nucleic acid-binding Zn-ribbon protein
MQSDPIDAAYQAEIDRSMARLEARYRKAQKALKSAEERAQRVRTATGKPTPRLDALVEARRRELREIELLMMPGNYAGREHRKRTAKHHSGRSAS